MKLNEINSMNRVTLYHGTNENNAKQLIQNGWQPNVKLSGANSGQSRYLYVTNIIENALWFANENGGNSVIEIAGVPLEWLMVDPEDGTADSVEEELELTERLGVPAYLVIYKPIPANRMRLIQ